jgi:hypothetical protein
MEKLCSTEVQALCLAYPSIPSLDYRLASTDGFVLIVGFVNFARESSIPWRTSFEVSLWI